MKQLSRRTADDTADLPVYAGELGPGEIRVRTGLVKNTGTEPITSLKLRVVNSPDLPAQLSATIGGTDLTDALQELLSAPLAPGGSLPLVETWTAGPDGLTGEDSGQLVGEFR